MMFLQLVMAQSNPTGWPVDGSGAKLTHTGDPTSVYFSDPDVMTDALLTPQRVYGGVTGWRFALKYPDQRE